MAKPGRKKGGHDVLVQYHERRCSSCKYQVLKFKQELGAIVPGCSRPLDGSGYPACYEKKEK